MKPPPMRNAGEWADAERHEPAFAARGGDWQTGYLPYWWGPLEAAGDYRTRQITVVAASQTGKTANVILSILGHRFADGPRVPTTLVFPTQKAVTDFSGDRLQRLIETTPSLDRIHEKGKRDARYLKFLGGVPVRLAWSGSSTELASNPAGLALVDEIDRMVKDVGGEGDPLTLIRARLITYHLHLLVVCSSPTIADVSPIQREFDGGSMEIAEWPCQHCGEFFRPMSEHIRFPERCSPQQAEEKARYVCPKCGVEHTEKDKLQMMRGMRWWVFFI
ncbi:MAG: phage terminase large subunit family protein [Gammaproteobacteria bacterium]|nr:phage terminase large subunit family protein [Gammaproteobacteria bacterium]